MSGVGAEAEVKDGQAVVGSGRAWFGGDAYGGSVGGTDRGGGGDGRDRDGYGLNQWGYNVAQINLGKEPNTPLAYPLVMEIHHLIMSKIGGLEDG